MDALTGVPIGATGLKMTPASLTALLVATGIVPPKPTLLSSVRGDHNNNIGILGFISFGLRNSTGESQCVALYLSDLQTKSTSAKLIIHRDALPALVITSGASGDGYQPTSCTAPEGTLLLIMKPDISIDAIKGVLTLTVSKQHQLAVVGRCKNFGRCNALKQNGVDRCRIALDKSKSEFCYYHKAPSKHSANSTQGVLTAAVSGKRTVSESNGDSTAAANRASSEPHDRKISRTSQSRTNSNNETWTVSNDVVHDKSSSSSRTLYQQAQHMAHTLQSASNERDLARATAAGAETALSSGQYGYNSDDDNGCNHSAQGGMSVPEKGDIAHTLRHHADAVGNIFHAAYNTGDNYNSSAAQSSCRSNNNSSSVNSCSSSVVDRSARKAFQQADALELQTAKKILQHLNEESSSSMVRAHNAKPMPHTNSNANVKITATTMRSNSAPSSAATGTGTVPRSTLPVPPPPPPAHTTVLAPPPSVPSNGKMKRNQVAHPTTYSTSSSSRTDANSGHDSVHALRMMNQGSSGSSALGERIPTRKISALTRRTAGNTNFSSSSSSGVTNKTMVDSIRGCDSRNKSNPNCGSYKLVGETVLNVAKLQQNADRYAMTSACAQNRLSSSAQPKENKSTTINQTHHINTDHCVGFKQLLADQVPASFSQQRLGSGSVSNVAGSSHQRKPNASQAQKPLTKDQQVARKAKASLLSEADALLSRSSAHADQADDAWFDGYSQRMDQLSKREYAQTRAAEVTSIELTAYQCMTCSTSDSSNSSNHQQQQQQLPGSMGTGGGSGSLRLTEQFPLLCQQSGHCIKKVVAVKRFFECAKCTKRESTLAVKAHIHHKIVLPPEVKCARCGAWAWRSSGQRGTGPLSSSSASSSSSSSAGGSGSGGSHASSSSFLPPNQQPLILSASEWTSRRDSVGMAERVSRLQ